jgi:hypothetical protein
MTISTTVPPPPSPTDATADQLRQELIFCTTEAKPSCHASQEQNPELSAEQLDKLFLIVRNPKKFNLLGPTALIEALKRIEKNDWSLARLIILAVKPRFTPVTTTAIAKRKINVTIPIKGLPQNYIHSAFGPEYIQDALYEAIEKDQWLTLITLLKNKYLLKKITAVIANELLFMAAITYQKYWLVHYIASSPFLGPQLTYETCDLIVKTNDQKAIAALRQSPYVETIMRQMPVPKETSTAKHDIVGLDNEPTQEDDDEVAAINIWNTRVDIELPRDASSREEQAAAFKSTHDCDDYFTWIKQHPTITTRPSYDSTTSAPRIP